VGRRAGAPHREEPGLGLRRRHTGQGAHLGVGELTPGQRLGQGGSVPSARATRTRSRAALRSSPTRQDSHAAQERNPLFQPAGRRTSG
jgi:hypothetical protein